MLAVKRSADIAPEVNLRNLLHPVEEAHKRGMNPGQMSPEVQNTGKDQDTETRRYHLSPVNWQIPVKISPSLVLRPRTVIKRKQGANKRDLL